MKRTDSSPSASAPGSSSGLVIIPADSPKLAQIRVEAVKLADLPVNEVVAPGKVEVNPNRVSRLPLPVPGRISEVLIKLGDAVSAGQPLLTIESPEVDAAQSAYVQAEAALTQAKAALVKAQADYDRVRDLYEHDAVAKKDVLNAESALIQAKAAVEQAKAAKEQALRRLKLLGVTPGDFRQPLVVRAPLSGKVLEINVVAGEYRNDTTAPVLTIADLRTVWVAANVPENSIRLIQIGKQVEITLDAYPGEVFHGRVARLGDTLDPQTRTVKVFVELENAQGRFRPEMFARLRYWESVQQMPVLPVGAVLQDDGQSVIFVEQSQGRFERREVVIGTRVGAMIAIVRGVSPGERVVVDGTVLLRNP
ncbi:MAG: efflux RND transporter periplasmic adaptor subunit [Blastocatellia bacterium]|nr:efflux RND transporter periplasmic adaptor subunit [Blastocatellia bacterium]MCS7156762.1 efflux RND transporter periplasmic adaptor subunit [Blastocatellia bacterium]MCX7752720.1 efflux RND transporter periplasmic adaptor subunit [Blastocatellia bacterium]MDW8167452.1 efflux RND transporter periplasmic adaptor subunit [Acidobacteriota bacterium]MDW8256799.1 efflux RND transporter periplasmic adaptor subunit [Acidobacteriota bacterium]